jgi:hypothetical protein
MRPQWWPIKDIPYDDMWAVHTPAPMDLCLHCTNSLALLQDDKIWYCLLFSIKLFPLTLYPNRLPELLNGMTVGYRFHFDKDIVLKYEALTEEERCEA